MTKYGDIDGDGFLEYIRHSSKGLVHQGWKDSHNSVFYKDGTPAKAPIALCEVQGYAYEAYLAGSVLATVVGELSKASEYLERANKLKLEFNKRFWNDEIGCYVLALDANKEQCAVKTSNAGQCLFSGIVDEDKAAKLVKTLFADDMFSGWGIRTLSTQERRYNPMSYHNGSVWPHDNALIALGLKRYGFVNECVELLTTFFDVSNFVAHHRLPELFCGFTRRAKEGPTPYPVACLPQSWAAASLFGFLEAALGLELSGTNNRITFIEPRLPQALKSLKIKNLGFQENKCDVLISTVDDYTYVTVLNKKGNIRIFTQK